MKNLENSHPHSGKASSNTEDDPQKYSTTMDRLRRSFSGQSEPNSSKATYSSYNNFLKNYGNKKFSTVKPGFAKDEAETNEKKTVKSEIFIQVNDPPVITNGKSNINDTTDFASLSHAKASKKPPYKPVIQRVQLQKLTHKESSPNPSLQALYVETKNENGNSQNYNYYRQISPSPKSPEMIPDQMIYAKTAVLNELMRRSSPIQAQENNNDQNPNTNASKSTNQIDGAKIVKTNGIPPAPKLPEFHSVDARPKLLPIGKAKNGVSVAPKPPEFHSSIEVPKTLEKTKSVIPPAPKLPELKSIPPKPTNFNSVASISQKLIQAEKINRTAPLQKFQSVGLEVNTKTVVPVEDGSANVDKSDPNVKKLVYNTYRGFLGAYNNKANDFVATLPRNMVFKDQGVNKQVESMALQGCLDRINGRVNPKVGSDLEEKEKIQ